MAAVRCRGNPKPVLQLSYVWICWAFCRGCWLYHVNTDVPVQADARLLGLVKIVLVTVQRGLQQKGNLF